MSGAILPLPQYAFMVWCSVKKKAYRQLHLIEVFVAMKIQIAVI